MKKIIAVLLSIIICGLFPLGASAEEKASTNSDVSAIKGTTVTVLATQINDYLMDRSNEYSIDYGVIINLVVANENYYYYYLTAQIAAGNSPDIAFFDISNINLLVNCKMKLNT